jgi:hypothetical protein
MTMDNTAILAIVNGALAILEQALPAIAQASTDGTITVEQQQAVYQRVSGLRAGGGAFVGPEWTVSSVNQTAG